VVAGLQYKALQMPAATNNFKTKHLNDWVNADTAWMDMRAWERCKCETLRWEDLEGESCYIGLDLATKTDIAALVAVFPRPEGRFAVLGRFYLPEDSVYEGRNSQYSGWAQSQRLVATSGAVTDFDVIEADLLDLQSRFNVRQVAFDPWQATQLASHMLERGLPMVEMRATVSNFSEPMKMLEALVLKGALEHDGDPVLEWMMSNVVAHLDAKENIYPRKERAENKIDGVVALIMALGRALSQREGSSVYEDRGVMVL